MTFSPSMMPCGVLGPYRLVHRLVRGGDVDGLEQLDLLVADAVGVGAGGGLHQGEGQHLHDVVLHDVAEGAGRLVEPAAVLDPEALGHGHLHLLDVAAVPDGLEDGVGEAQGEHVLHRLLPHVVVDPVDLALVEGGVHLFVEGDGAGEVAPVGLLHHHPDERAAVARPGAGVGRPAPRPPGRTRWGWWPGSRGGCRRCRRSCPPRRGGPSARRRCPGGRTRRRCT